MKLPWRQPDRGLTGRQSGARGGETPAQASPGLSRALERILEFEQPRILDLGPLCGDTAVRLAARGARVSVESFEGPPAAPPAVDGEEPPPPPAIRLAQEDGQFHLVLVWEHVDFVPPDRLREFGAELRRVLAPGGYALIFARNTPAEEDPLQARPGRFRLLDDERLVREAAPGPACARFVHPTREIERSLAPLSIQSLHLQRNQTREFLARRKPD